MKKLAVVGSRTFNDYECLKRVLQPWMPAHIVSGGARGADALAERLAHEYDLPITVIKPDWKQHGRAAGPIRNRTIVDTADLVVAFWNGQSRGTGTTVKYAREKGKTIIIEKVNDV